MGLSFMSASQQQILAALLIERPSVYTPKSLGEMKRSLLKSAAALQKIAALFEEKLGSNDNNPQPVISTASLQNRVQRLIG